VKLSIRVTQTEGTPTFACSGKLLRGEESDYLFELITRPDHRDVVLDLEELSAFDREGLSTIRLCYEVLGATKRKLFVRNAPADMLMELAQR
jgi:anti-anti-sigma regulatory factor